MNVTTSQKCVNMHKTFSLPNTLEQDQNHAAGEDNKNSNTRYGPSCTQAKVYCRAAEVRAKTAERVTDYAERERQYGPYQEHQRKAQEDRHPVDAVSILRLIRIIE